MLQAKIKYSFVICTFNGANRISRCLDSIFAIRDQKINFEVIVVDDASIDQTVAIVARYPVTLAQHKENKGISTARNTGFKASKGEIIICLDDDCVVRSDFLIQLEKKYQNSDIIGVAANLEYPQNISLVDFYFRSIWYGVAIPATETKDKSVLSRLLWYYLNCPWQSQRRNYVDGVKIIDMPAACASYRRQALEQVNGWDESLKNSGEDTDLCLRIIETFKEKRVILALDATVTHYQDLSFLGSIRRDLDRRSSKLLFYKKHHMLPSFFVNPVIFILILPFCLFFPFAIVFLPMVVFPWWLYRFMKSFDWRFLVFPYMQLVQESVSNVSILLSLGSLK